MIDYLIRHPTLSNLIMVTFIVLGVSSLGSIKRETFPEFSPLVVTASVVYPGASPMEVEESLCQRMENAVDGLGNIDEVQCVAQEGVATLRVTLTERADLGRSLLDIQTQINAIKDFPSQIEPPVVKELGWAEPVVDVAIAADISRLQLKDYAEDLKRRLKTEAGVSLVDVSGFSDRQIRVELDPLELRRMGMSAMQVADQVRRQNVKLPLGTIELDEKSLLIRFDERKISATTLGETVVDAKPTGGVIRLKDIAVISERFELDEVRINFNGMPAAVLNIKKNKADDAMRIKAKVQAFIDQESLRVPEGMTLTLTNDLSSLVRDRLTMMVNNGLQGIVLVFLTMWLFFSLRYSLWVSAGLPVAFLGGLFLMNLFGVSINIMSLVGLLMAIGIMMDDAIVIAESIAAHVEKKIPTAEAVVRGVVKVAPGVLSSFLTTVFIFGSLLWLEGQMGAVLAVVPMVLILVLSVSLVEAFLILPNHLYHSIEHTSHTAEPWRFKREFVRRFENFRQTTLVKVVTVLVKWRYATLGATLGLLMLSLSLLLGGVIKFNAFPELEGDIATARIILPPGTPLSKTQEIVDRIANSAIQIGMQLNQTNNEPSPLIDNISKLTNVNVDAGESGPHLATVNIDLLSAEIRQTRMDEFVRRWRDHVGELPESISLVFKQPQMGPAGRDIEVRLQSDDLIQLKLASIELQAYLSQFNGVYGILDDMRPGKEEIIIRLKPGAEVYGVDGATIADQLRTAYFGQVVDEIQVGVENIEVDVRLDKSKIADLRELENFVITLNNGNRIPLSSVASLENERSFIRIQRVDGLRTVAVFADVDTAKANSSELTALIKQEMAPVLIEKYPGLRVSFEGSNKETGKTGSSMAKGFLIGLFGIFAVLSFQFKSYLQPLVVMLAIPMALIGVIFGHLLVGYSFSMPSIMGFISLAGIVVNDSILLVQYIRHHVELGDSIHEAVVSASRERFRAVFLTSLTTAAGLLPLLLETSLQAQVVKPLVISIVFGLLASTCLVVLVIPCAYAVLADFGLVRLHHKQQSKVD